MPAYEAIGKGVISAIFLIAFYIASSAILAGLLYGLYYAGMISSNSLQFMIEAALLISLSIAVFAHSRIYKRERFSYAIKQLGLSKGSISVNAIWIGLLLFIIIFLMEIAVGAFGSASNTVINTNSGMIFIGAPLWFYIFVAVVEPINEEIFFRGFLVNRIGIIASAIIFGLLHSSYDSTFAIEVIAATFFGLVSGYVFKKSGSLYPSIIAHIIIDSMAVFAILGLLG